MNDVLNIEDRDIRYKLHSFVPPLMEVDQAWEALKNKYPQILADLTSAKFNPNCSCRGRVGSFLNEKYESSAEDKDFIFKLFSISEVAQKSEEIVKEIRKRELAVENFPKIHVVEKGEAAWKNFLEHLKNNDFEPRGFSVVNRDEKTLNVYLM